LEGVISIVAARVDEVPRKPTSSFPPVHQRQIDNADKQNDTLVYELDNRIKNKILIVEEARA
jgi:hypothetical protein